MVFHPSDWVLDGTLNQHVNFCIERCNARCKRVIGFLHLLLRWPWPCLLSCKQNPKSVSTVRSLLTLLDSQTPTQTLVLTSQTSQPHNPPKLEVLPKHCLRNSGAETEVVKVLGRADFLKLLKLATLGARGSLPGTKISKGSDEKAVGATKICTSSERSDL